MQQLLRVWLVSVRRAAKRQFLASRRSSVRHFFDSTAARGQMAAQRETYCRAQNRAVTQKPTVMMVTQARIGNSPIPRPLLLSDEKAFF